jgi:O-acetyl-ADP-ribose deacetylase (regulator of RNase III)
LKEKLDEVKELRIGFKGDSMQIKVNQTVLELVKGDITELETDAIVNAANSHLKMGGGVAGAIRRKGGNSIQDECDRIGHCPVGSAVITRGGNLKAKGVIHAVGPVWGEGKEDEKLRSAVLSVLNLARERKIATVALPAISAGIFGFPMKRCAGIMLSTAIEWSKGNAYLDKVVFCLYDDNAFNTFKEELNRLKKEIE